jgi:hypothetical protein
VKGPWLWAGLVIVVALGAAAAGYAVGASRAPDQSDAASAQSASFAQALATSRSETEQAAHTKGLAAGATIGRRVGLSQGQSDGLSAGQSAASSQVAASTSSSCGPGQYNYQGNGCVPLDCPGAGCAHPPTPPATLESCPAGQVPVGSTGACAPPN